LESKKDKKGKKGQEDLRKFLAPFALLVFFALSTASPTSPSTSMNGPSPLAGEVAAPLHGLAGLSS
jgi:hypothetical protein